MVIFYRVQNLYGHFLYSRFLYGHFLNCINFDRIKSDRINFDLIKIYRIKTDRIKSITDPRQRGVEWIDVGIVSEVLVKFGVSFSKVRKMAKVGMSNFCSGLVTTTSNLLFFFLNLLNANPLIFNSTEVPARYVVSFSKLRKMVEVGITNFMQVL
jgi:hypothetical protein